VENMGGEALPFNDEFDMINMSVTFHEIVPDVRVKVMENAYRALKTGGKLLIFDFKYPDKIEDFRNPEYALSVIDAFDEIVLGVVHLTRQEQNEMFTGLGFKDIQRMDIEGFTGLEIITATK
jgi:SAM-dependent methyltransferase